MNSPQIEAIIQDFIAQLSRALAEEGSEAIRVALGGLPTASAPAKRASSAAAPKRAAQAAAPAKARAKGGKRTPEELEAQTKALLAQIKKTPGDRIETISKAIGISTKDLALPVIKLLESKAISKKGHRRSTTYYPKG